jgi:hypothetical protein
MGAAPRDDGSKHHDAIPAPGDETPEDRPEDRSGVREDGPVVAPIPDKIGEGGTNLQDRNAALNRRRGRTRPSG